MRIQRFNIPISIDFAVLLLRVLPSLFMLTHGFPKLIKLFSGDWSFADPFGIGEGLSLIITVWAEFFCSILVIVGFLTRPALLILAFVMLAAALIVHADDPFKSKEMALLYFTIYMAIFITGPGRISIDSRIFS
jgi:putative oxidoreductase